MSEEKKVCSVTDMTLGGTRNTESTSGYGSPEKMPKSSIL